MISFFFFLYYCITNNREKPETSYAAVLRGMLFLSRTAAPTEFIFELAEL